MPLTHVRDDTHSPATEPVDQDTAENARDRRREGRCHANDPGTAGASGRFEDKPGKRNHDQGVPDQRNPISGEKRQGRGLTGRRCARRNQCLLHDPPGEMTLVNQCRHHHTARVTVSSWHIWVDYAPILVGACQEACPEAKPKAAKRVPARERSQAPRHSPWSATYPIHLNLV